MSLIIKTNHIKIMIYDETEKQEILSMKAVILGGNIDADGNLDYDLNIASIFKNKNYNINLRSDEKGKTFFDFYQGLSLKFSDIKKEITDFHQAINTNNLTLEVI